MTATATPRHKHTLPLIAALPLLGALFASGAQAGESYLSLGLPGVQAGYAQTVNTYLGLRADVSSTGTVNKNGTQSGIDYQGKVKYNRAGLFADVFPFAGGFRLTGGLTFNDANIDLRSQFDGTQTVTINGYTFAPHAGDYLNAKASFPKTTPYVGLGWGHQAREAAGLGFVMDVGASIGRAKLDTATNMVGQTYVTNAGAYQLKQSDVDSKTQELRDGVGKVQVLPQISLGLSYRY